MDVNHPKSGLPHLPHIVNVKKAEEVSSSVRGENPGNGPQEGVCSITEQNAGCTTGCLYPLLPEPLIILCIFTAWHAALSQEKGLVQQTSALPASQVAHAHCR